MPVVLFARRAGDKAKASEAGDPANAPGVHRGRIRDYHCGAALRADLRPGYDRENFVAMQFSCIILHCFSILTPARKTL